MEQVDTMSLFCRHEWTEVARRFSRPQASMKLRGLEDKTAERIALELAYGITVIELHCDVCGSIKHHRLPGDATAAPE